MRWRRKERLARWWSRQRRVLKTAIATVLSIGTFVGVSTGASLFERTKDVLDASSRVAVRIAGRPVDLSEKKGDAGRSAEVPIPDGTRALTITWTHARWAQVALALVVPLLVFFVAWSVLLHFALGVPPPLRGRQLLVRYRVEPLGAAEDKTTLTLEYRGLETTDGADINLPIDLFHYYPTDDGTKIEIRDLTVLHARGAEIVPRFFRTPIYRGVLRFPRGHTQPVDFTLQLEITNTMPRNAFIKRKRWTADDPGSDSVTWGTQHVSWDEVEVALEWAEDSTAGRVRPWVTTQTTDAAQAHAIDGMRDVTWDADRWTLRAKDVAPGRSFTIQWALEERSARADDMVI